MHDVDTGDEFDSGLISIAHSTTRREVRHGRPGPKAVACLSCLASAPPRTAELLAKGFCMGASMIAVMWRRSCAAKGLILEAHACWNTGGASSKSAALRLSSSSMPAAEQGRVCCETCEVMAAPHVWGLQMGQRASDVTGITTAMVTQPSLPSMRCVARSSFASPYHTLLYPTLPYPIMYVFFLRLPQNIARHIAEGRFMPMLSSSHKFKSILMC